MGKVWGKIGGKVWRKYHGEIQGEKYGEIQEGGGYEEIQAYGCTRVITSGYGLACCKRFVLCFEIKTKKEKVYLLLKRKPF